MEKICSDPVRYSDSKQVIKKGLFSKKESTNFAVCDENGTPLTEYIYRSLCEYENGVVAAVIPVTKTSGKIVYLDTDGKQLLKQFYDKGMYAEMQDGYFIIKRSAHIACGLAALDGTVLIEPDPKFNTVQISGDIVVYGNTALTTGPDYNELRAGRLCGGSLVDILPRPYTLVTVFEDGVIAVGRYEVSEKREMNSLTTDKVTRTATKAFMLFSKDGKPLTDKIFSELHKTGKGNYSGTVCPNIKPEELYYKRTTSDYFNGTGMLDFSGSKGITFSGGSLVAEE